MRGPGAGRSSSASDPAHSLDTEKGAFHAERPLFADAAWRSALLRVIAILIGPLTALLAILTILLLLLFATLFLVALLLLIGILVSHCLSPFRHAIAWVT